MPPPLVLVDTPDDDPLETRGWVETTVSEEAARDLLAPLCADEDGNTPHRPQCGEAKRVWLKPMLLDFVGEEESVEEWVPMEPAGANDGAREFWEIAVV